MEVNPKSAHAATVALQSRQIIRLRAQRKKLQLEIDTAATQEKEKKCLDAAIQAGNQEIEELNEDIDELKEEVRELRQASSRKPAWFERFRRETCDT